MRLLATALLLTAAFTGCVASQDLQPAAVTPPDVEAAATNLTVPIAFDGVTPVYGEACAWAPVGGRCASTPGDYSKIRFEPELEGTPGSLKVTITWAAVAPATQQMTIFAGIHDGGSFKGIGGKMGPSPLTLEIADLEAPDGSTVYIGLAGPATGRGAQGAGANASGNAVSQPWKAEGEITLVDPATS